MSPTDDDADSDNEQLQRYAQTIRDLRISHEAGHAVLAEHFGYKLLNLTIEAVIVSADEGATGGSTDIDWNRLYPNSPDFDERLLDAAAVFMGGRAAEELTHPHLASASHWKIDISDFKDRVRKVRTEVEMDAILEEGYLRAKTLLSNPEISEQHNHLRRFLATEHRPQQRNGRFLVRVMKGLSS